MRTPSTMHPHLLGFFLCRLHLRYNVVDPLLGILL